MLSLDFPDVPAVIVRFFRLLFALASPGCPDHSGDNSQVLFLRWPGALESGNEKISTRNKFINSCSLSPFASHLAKTSARFLFVVSLTFAGPTWPTRNRHFPASENMALPTSTKTSPCRGSTFQLKAAAKEAVLRSKPYSNSC